jgi:hypothetical protein
MSAPKFSPMPPVNDTRSYASPDHVPDRWMPDRPGEILGPQPRGERLGTPGPDQGFALRIARQLEPEIELQPGEHLADAVRGCLNIALRRASMFSRAPVVHDLRMAFTMWGFFDPQPPAELVERRRELFEGVGHTAHHYAEGRHLADLVSESTLRLTPAEMSAQYPQNWQALTGA